MVFPQSTEDVAAVVRIAIEHGIPIVGRGAGHRAERRRDSRAGGIVVSFARMNRILEIDLGTSARYCSRVS